MLSPETKVNILLHQKLSARPKTKIKEPPQRPVCCDLGCIWFCRLMGSIITIALCYYFAYTFISDTKLKFGLFVP
ncbi:unnamed protein product [Pieris brassicae]|uniref:Uncharacterized protein n=1 Tax=Pieris brassicae TaxID=7116 RepID=A0A9P0SRM4_PIEBR|nr:unnamed protein product [Pieris brassicae]